ncbi:dephospho-CoA kinase [Defluviitalea phaphyphila]|uniref:dephospho-CoA kinase n=1 Tax=Defluviitalea phaphyphila TaxID=1473580 RepID=UPI00073160AE|nr:dephospho-CoA kinase [Defluviitalea phaphyphila]
MKIIGLTGGSGSGKSTVVTILSEMTTVYIIDADKIGHKIILKGNPAYYDIINYFGKKILKEDGEIDRKILGKIVFSDKNDLKKLNEITHYRIKEYIINTIKEIKKTPSLYKYIIIDAALLIETGLHTLVDEIWVVYARLEDRIKRIMERDNISEEQARRRINSQISWEELKKYANRIIYNEKNKEFLKEQLISILK